jgi:hypothetical protein
MQQQQLLVVTLILLAFLSPLVSAQYYPYNQTFIDNGDVCQNLTDTSEDPPTTCVATALSGTLNAVLASCAVDDYIEITLEDGFYDTAPFLFPNVKRISIFGTSTNTTLAGSQSVAEGNETELFFFNVTFDGLGTTNLLFDPNLRSNNLSLVNCTTQNFFGTTATLIEGCEEWVTLTMTGSICKNVYGACIFASGLSSYNLRNNTYDRCGGNNNSCVFVKDGWHTQETQVFFRNRCWLLYDELAPLCINCIDPACHVRCFNEQVECEDLTATLEADDCPLVNISYINPLTNLSDSELVYADFCKRYKPCTCDTVFFRDVTNLTLGDIALKVGDVIYHDIILECQPGSNLVAGGSAAPVAAIAFYDPELELVDVDPLSWVSSSALDVSICGTGTVPKPAARSADCRMICYDGEDRWVEQVVQLTGTGNYLVGFWMARLDNMRDRFGNAFVELYLNGTLVSTIADPQFHDTLVADNLYFETFFPSFSATADTYVLRVRCNFVGVTQNVILTIDDFFSLDSGLQLIYFPPGLGEGPPLGADPLDYIATPLTSDATLILPVCPLCPDVPPRPDDVVCQYTIDQSFQCYETEDMGVEYCVVPGFDTLGVGVALQDPSLENATCCWTEDIDSPIQDDSGTPQPANTGTWLMLCADATIAQISQSVDFTPGGPSALYTLQFYARRQSGQQNNFGGKFVQFLLDGSPVATISDPTFQTTLTDNANYFLFSFPQVPITGALHTVSLKCDMTGGPHPADLQIDDIQFLGAFAAPTPSPTPSISPSSSPSASSPPSPSAAPVPADTLECSENVLYYQGMIYTGPCLLPKDLPVGNYTAQECLLLGVCTVPDAYAFQLNGFTLTCVSASSQLMSCDCSAATLLNTLLNRTIAANSSCFEFDKIPNSASAFFVRENDAMQHTFGAIMRRIDASTVVESSQYVIDYHDELSVLRETSKQNRLYGLVGNPQMSLPHLKFDALPEYEEVCVDHCPIFNPVFPGMRTVCVVDSAASDFDPTIYALVQDAIDDPNCTREDSIILLQASENFHEENLLLNQDFIHLFCKVAENCTIVGYHKVGSDTNTLMFRGLTLVHSGENGIPLLDFSDAGDLSNFTFRNNYVTGAAVKNSGLIRNRKKQIAFADVADNLFVDFQTTTLRVDAKIANVERNRFEFCTGRVVQIRHTGPYHVQHNVFIDSRGAQNVEKPAIIEVRYVGARGSEPCTVRGECLLRNNVQIEEDAEFAPDYKETGILVVNCAVWVEDVRDNVFVKARTGFRCRRCIILATPDDLALLDPVTGFLASFQFYNPKIRPSRTRIASGGEDFMIDGYYNGERIAQQRCSFPECTAPNKRPQRCIANLNFDAFNARQFGWEIFTNLTDAAFFCSLNLVEVTVFGGARIIPERVRLRRPFSDSLLFPLKDTTSVKQIINQDRPMPSRFMVEGTPVDVLGGDITKFAALLDANNTYAFGTEQLVFVSTFVRCVCPGELFGIPTQFSVQNCTALPFLDVCPTLDPGPGNTLLNCTQLDMFCADDGYTAFFGLVEYEVFDCNVTVQYCYSDVDANEFCTSVVYSENMTYPLQQCTLEIRDNFQSVFSQSTVNTCVRPAYYTIRSTFRALNISFTALDFYLHYPPDLDDNDRRADILASEIPAADVLFYNVGFYGRKVDAFGKINALHIQSGLVDPDLQLNRKKENQRKPIVRRATVHNCTFADFLFYATILNNTAGTLDDMNEVFDFPSINALFIEAVDPLPSDDSVVNVTNNYFYDIDRRAVDLRKFNITIFTNNTGWHVGGRSLENSAAIYIDSLDTSPNSILYFLYNNITQKKIVTYPFLADRVQPSYTTMVQIGGFAERIYDACAAQNLTVDQCMASTLMCCPSLIIRDNFICGLPIGIRFVGGRDPMTQHILNGLPPTQIPKFDDELIALREVAFANSANIDGTVCDLMHGEPYNDFFEENLCCQETCAPNDPAVCRINSTDARITPLHPWWNVFWFIDPNQCMELCQARGRECLYEQTSDLRTYDVRLNASITNPPIFRYRNVYASRVTINVISTQPPGSSSPQQPVRMRFEDDSLAPVFFVIIPGVLEQNSDDEVVRFDMTMPEGVPEGVPTLTPAGWIADIDITFTFIAPNVFLQLPKRVYFNLTYTSPVFAVQSIDEDYLALVQVSWEWINAPADLIDSIAMTLTGVGNPVTRCAGHSLNGTAVTVRFFTLLHAQPCTDLTVGPDCPCLPGIQPPQGALTYDYTCKSKYIMRDYIEHEYGEATWNQNDTDYANGLRLVGMTFDGDDYDALAIDGLYHGRVTFQDSMFVRYKKRNPGFVARVVGSLLDGCCGLPNCTTEAVFKDNTFMGASDDTMPGSVIAIANVTGSRVDSNTFENCGSVESPHPLPMVVYQHSCPTAEATNSLVLYRNEMTRTQSGTENDRIPPSDCYWAAYTTHNYPSGGVTVKQNDQVLTGSAEDRGAAVCLRVVDWLVPPTGVDCRSPLRDIAIDEGNFRCDGVKFDIASTFCCEDVCIAARRDCFGDGGDTACQDAMADPACNKYRCYFCNNACTRTHFPFWVMFGFIVAGSILSKILCWLVWFGIRYLCCSAMPIFIWDARVQTFVPGNAAYYGMYASLQHNQNTVGLPPVLPPTQTPEESTTVPLTPEEKYSATSISSAIGDAAPPTQPADIFRRKPLLTPAQLIRRAIEKQQ